jgi:transcriptional regulator with XRE-family HTH domain
MGMTQEKLAEMANVSTHYIAMIETCKKYPKPEMLEHIAQTLKIETYKLFSVVSDPNEPLERFRQSVVTDIRQMVIDIKQDMIEAVVKAIDSKCR